MRIKTVPLQSCGLIGLWDRIDLTRGKKSLCDIVLLEIHVDDNGFPGAVKVTVNVDVSLTFSAAFSSKAPFGCQSFCF